MHMNVQRAHMSPRLGYLCAAAFARATSAPRTAIRKCILLIIEFEKFYYADVVGASAWT